MLDLLQSTRINSDASDEDLKPGEYRDALNISNIANEVGAFSKGTTYGNVDTNIVFKGLNPDAICLGTAIDTAGTRIIITFYQEVPIPFNVEYQGVLNYAASRGFQLPSPQVQIAQNFLITLLKQDGIWVGLDVFYCFFGDGDEDFAKINWKLPNDATTAVNHGLTYLANSGFTSDGASYLDTKWIPSTGVKYTLNNACLVLGLEEITVLSAYDGVVDGTKWAYIFPYQAANTIIAAVNSATDAPAFVDPQITNNAGLIFASRSTAGITALRKNTSSSFPGAIISSGLPTISFFIGAVNFAGSPSSFTTNRYTLFAAGEYLNTFDREIKFYNNALIYKNSFVTPLITETHTQEVLMYLLVEQVGGVIPPLVKSSLMRVSATSYLDGYSFVNDLFFFNFRESAPKVINIQRALDSPGFYDNIAETSLTVIKPHPPYSPVPVRAIGTQVGAPIQRKPFQFMMVYNFVDGEQSTKSPASEYLNSLDDVRDAEASAYDHINVTMDFPQKDYSIVQNVELFVRNNNAIADWRSVNVFVRTLFVQAGENYRFTYQFFDNVVGNFLPLELGTKINDAIPQRSNYLAFIENRIFMIDSLLDYDFTNTFQIKVDLDAGNPPLPDDRRPSSSPLYGLAEFEYDSEYTIGLAFYDKYGRKYPSSSNDKKLVTPPFTIFPLPATGSDDLPNYLNFGVVAGFPDIKRPKITAKYDLRAAGNIANYGKPPSFAFWWGMIRGKNTKWEFQHSVHCLLRFPYSITKWPDTDPAKFPDPNLFLEDGFLYWHVEKLLYGTSGTGLDFTKFMVNDYIDIVIPPSFPYPIDNTVLIDFMIEVTTKDVGVHVQLRDREVIETFANKIRVRGDRAARWFSNAGPGIGQFRVYPKYTTGVSLTADPVTGIVIRNDESTFPLIIKRRRKNNLESIILYDTPQVYPVNNPGTKFATFQPTQTASIVRAEYPPNFIAPVLARTLNQGDILIQPIFLTPTTAAFNHAIKITWGPNVGDSLRLKIKVSLWQLNDLNQPIIELYSATGDAGGPYLVKNNETSEYLINAEAELINGWYGYGIQILEATATNVQFENPEFDIQLQGWLQSPEGISDLVWRWGSVVGNFAYVNVSALGSGFSKTIYQFLNQVSKDELTVEVTIEGVGLSGPNVNGPIIQYPGNAQLAPVNNASEQIFDLGRNVVPYFIDCDTIVRKATLNTLTYTLNTVAPVGGIVRAEIWRVDQVTKQPVSVIAGSEGADTVLPTVPGTYTIPFGVNKIIDTTGWYGIALVVDLPTFGDFLDKNYANGSASWVVKAGSPTWAFMPDTNLPDVYEDALYTSPFGTDLGYQPMNTKYDLVQPIFIGVGSDPNGYSNHRIVIDWGDNTENGWYGKNINVAIWDVDQVTKKPTSFTPIMQSATTIGTGGPTEHFISNASMLLPNKWYGFGFRIPSGHTQSAFTQFTNPSLGSSHSGWTTVAGPTGISFNSSNVASGSGTNYNSGTIAQNKASKYTQVVVATSVITGFTQLYVDILLGSVVKQTINLGNGSAYSRKFIVFNAFFANGSVAIKFYGSGPSTCSVTLNGIYDFFDPYLFSTPRVRKYAPATSDNEVWANYGYYSPGMPIDSSWKEAYTYWRYSTQGQVGATADLTITPGTSVPYVNALLAGNQTTGFLYGYLGRQDSLGTNFTLTASGQKYISSPGSSFLQLWAFNNPADFLSGTMVDNIQFLGNDTYEPFNVSHSVFIPAGYKYLGYRFLSNGSAPTFNLSSLYVTHGAGYNGWTKDDDINTLAKNTIGVTAKERQLVSLGGFVVANFHADGIAPAASSAQVGQNTIVGILVRANIEVFSGSALNNYTLLLYDSVGTLLGSTVVVGQALGANVQISINVITAPLATGLFLAVQNNNSVGNISVRIRQITNVNAPVNIGADSGIANAKTWRIDNSNNMVQLTTTSATRIDGTEDAPQPANAVTVVLADASGAEISAPQTFTPNAGPQVLLFAPTLAVAGNFNYGVKVKNNPVNGQLLGTIRIHSVFNVATNDGIANIVAHTINPGQPLYEAWNQFSLGAFVRAGYVSNFIAVVSDIVMSPFTPVQINPTSYHLVANITPAGIFGHSVSYSGPPDSPYNYGFVYPSISSDPDAAGIVYEQKTGQSIGDINLKDIDQRQKSQSNIVRWSDPVIAGTRVNNLNSFLDSNKYSVDFQRGAIQVMIAMHDHTLFCVHTQGMSSLYVQRATMISPSEIQGQDSQLFLTNKVVGSDNKLTSNLGTVNPESCRVVESGTIAYGMDLIRKSFWQKTNNGVRNLTYECNAKKFFNEICFYRLQAHNEGEDIKIYSGYNEKQKSFYLTFAPFIFRGQPYPGVTIAYNAYIDGFLSRYSFEPMSYLATEDVIHSVKARELTNPDFFGDFEFWKTIAPDATHTADWFKSLVAPVGAKADTTVPGGTRILNPDFIQGPTFWTTYGAGSAWAFVNDGAETTIPAAGSSRDLVNSSGAPATYLIRISARLPVAGLTYSLKVYDNAGVPLETLLAATPMTGDDVVEVTQTLVGRIGVIITNTTGAPILTHLNLFTTVVKTFLLYQLMPVAIEDLRVRLVIPPRVGSFKALIYAFNDPLAPFMTLLHTVDQIRLKDQLVVNVNVSNAATAKYIGLYTITDYDTTVLSYFNVNSVPSIWRHDQSGRTNNFFGVQYDSMLDLVFNVQAGQVRIFNSLGVMSETAWSVESFVTSDRQISMLSAENFELRDGIYSATIMRDILTPQEALPDPVNNTPLTHGTKLTGVSIRMVLRNSETLRQIELRAVYMGSDELAGNLLAKK